MVRSNAPALVVGFAAEATVARLSGWRVAIGGGTSIGADRAARRLIEAGATGIVSFGLAGGLDPALRAGALVVPRAVTCGGNTWATDPALNARLGGSTGHLCLALDRIIVSVADKQRLRRDTEAALVDMESGAVAAAAAEHGVPFAVLRVVCDPANRALPPAALVALDAAGKLLAGRLARSIVTEPRQLASLCKLARDAMIARRALRGRALWMAPEAASGRVLAKALLPEGMVSEGIL